jgi:hypothetical protein
MRRIAAILFATLFLTGCENVRSCIFYCHDGTEVQRTYVNARNDCQQLAEDKVHLFLNKDGGTNDPKKINSSLLALFAKCMHIKDWGVTAPKQEQNRPIAANAAAAGSRAGVGLAPGFEGSASPVGDSYQQAPTPYAAQQAAPVRRAPAARNNMMRNAPAQQNIMQPAQDNRYQPRQAQPVYASPPPQSNPPAAVAPPPAAQPQPAPPAPQQNSYRTAPPPAYDQTAYAPQTPPSSYVQHSYAQHSYSQQPQPSTSAYAPQSYQTYDYAAPTAVGTSAYGYQAASGNHSTAANYAAIAPASGGSAPAPLSSASQGYRPQNPQAPRYYCGQIIYHHHSPPTPIHCPPGYQPMQQNAGYYQPAPPAMVMQPPSPYAAY